jgi:hypothetical protein
MDISDVAEFGSIVSMEGSACLKYIRISVETSTEVDYFRHCDVVLLSAPDSIT